MYHNHTKYIDNAIGKLRNEINNKPMFGPPGIKGNKGDKGDKGIKGEHGIDGSKIIFVCGIPNNTIGKNEYKS